MGRVKVFRTVKQKIALTGKICRLYEKGKYTIEGCCKRYGVSYRSFMSWVSENETSYIAEVAAIYQASKVTLDFMHQEDAIAMAKQALAEKLKVEVRRRTKNKYKVSDTGEEILKEVVEIEERILPDLRLIIFVLKKLQPEKWDNKSQESALSEYNSPYRYMTDEELRAKKEEILNQLKEFKDIE